MFVIVAMHYSQQKKTHAFSPLHSLSSAHYGVSHATTKLNWHEVVVHKNVFRDCVKHVAMQRCHITQWHNGLKRSGKVEMPFRTTSVQNDPTWKTTQFNHFHPCWMLIVDGLRVISSGSRSMSQNCVPHSALYSGLLQTCSALDTPWNFRGSTMAPLYSCTGLVGPVSKGKCRLSLTNRRYGRNLGSLIRTKLETPIKWMEASRFSRPKKFCHTQFLKVMFIVEYAIGGIILHHAVPPRQTVNTAYYCTCL